MGAFASLSPLSHAFLGASKNRPELVKRRISRDLASGSWPHSQHIDDVIRSPGKRLVVRARRERDMSTGQRDEGGKGKRENAIDVLVKRRSMSEVVVLRGNGVGN